MKTDRNNMRERKKRANTQRETQTAIKQNRHFQK